MDMMPFGFHAFNCTCCCIGSKDRYSSLPWDEPSTLCSLIRIQNGMIQFFFSKDGELHFIILRRRKQGKIPTYKKQDPTQLNPHHTIQSVV
jgi:hypothetical protein